MQWGKLIDILKKNQTSFIIWHLGNVGGLIIAYLAIITIFVFSGANSNYYPDIHEYLIVGGISVTVSGASYISLRKETTVELNIGLQLIWVFLLLFVYGALVVLCSRATTDTNLIIWIASGVLFVVCLFWSSVTWLHEQGIRNDGSGPQTPKSTPPKKLTDAAKKLPKIDGKGKG